ncbi:MAG: hypothetical protein U9O89_04905 [Thermoproteota archaeon]|nr:hypothetical protein [Thermoproteota archaeon]
MGERVKVFLTVAVLGFMAGVIANLAYVYVVPALEAILPEIFQIGWVLSGLGGAVLTLFMVTVWAYITGPTTT